MDFVLFYYLVHQQMLLVSSVVFGRVIYNRQVVMPRWSATLSARLQECSKIHKENSKFALESLTWRVCALKQKRWEEVHVWVLLLAIFVSQGEFTKRNVGGLISLTNVVGFTAETWFLLVIWLMWRGSGWAPEKKKKLTRASRKLSMPWLEASSRSICPKI